MSHFVVSARKYRPARFEEVMGQNHVARTLKNALKTDHLAHAFLFCGPRGVGKTTTARILAKTINCERMQEHYEPCSECGSCKSFDENSSFNIIEIDAASHNSVDNMRSLVEQIRFTPPTGGKKVYIIDEVHMLSASAFNAFLKTLEEPPAHAIFILATTEKHKIIPTILSRCQVFDFKRIQVPDIVIQLKNICAAENIAAEDDALILIGQKADGALRDALSIFDRVVSLSGKELHYQHVIESLNLLDYDYFFRLTDAILKEDMTTALSIFDEILKNGFEGELLVSGLAAHFRDLLMCKDEKTIGILDHGQALKSRYVDQSLLVNYGQVLSYLNIANKCDVQLFRAQNKRLQVELMLAKLCFFNKMKSASLTSDNGEKKKPEHNSTLKTTATQEGFEDKTVRKETTTSDQAMPIAESTSESAELPADRGEESTKNLIVSTAEDAESSNDSPTTNHEQQVDSTEKEADKNEKPSSNASPNLNISKVTGGIVKIPQLGSLSNLESKIKANAAKAKANMKPLNDEELNLFWEQYVESIQSPSVKSTLVHAAPSVEEGKVRIAVGTQTARTRILEENDLIEAIRKNFTLPTVELDVWVDPEMSPFEQEITKPKKLLTNKEKYLLLTEKNPLIRDLKNTLDLIVDQEN